MAQLSDNDYYALNQFVRTVLRRVQYGECSADEGTSDIMHPLTAWDKENWTEFGPWMERRMEQWSAEDA
jgi:hypothetical protein